MPEEQKPQITLSDIQNAVQIIDVAASRGAFRGPEMSSVGVVRDRLSTFVESAAPPAEENAAEGEQAKANGDGSSIEGGAEEAPRKPKTRKTERPAARP